MLKPQDLLVMLKLAVLGEPRWTYASLAVALGLSASEAHAAVDRATAAGLYSTFDESAIRPALAEFIVHGVRYAFATRPGVPTSRGIATGFAVVDGQDAVPEASRYVWPDVDGTVSGRSVTPLYRSAPFAATQDQDLYVLLALVDEIRIGRARERTRAAREIMSRLGVTM